jgi:putative transposase
MSENIDFFSLKSMCRVLVASRSGYYAWRQKRHQPSEREQRRLQIDRQVVQLLGARKQRYGAPRLTLDLRDDGLRCNRKTVALSLQRHGLRAKAAKRFKATTYSGHDLPVAENLLQQDFTATAPNTKWVSDLTYLWTDEGWLYLAVVIDLYSRLVVGWSMGERMTAYLVCDALQMALWRRYRPQGVIVHSDRGSQYCSAKYRTLLEDHRLHCSMSAKGCCYDNACAESFFHSFKVEAVHGERFATRQAMTQMVFEYIEVDYNRIRRHSTNGFISPVQFEALRVA